MDTKEKVGGWEIHYCLTPNYAKKWGVERSSDSLDWECSTLADAYATIRAIKADPEFYGYVKWLTDAVMWAERNNREE